jgi:hypothetical protein
MLFAKRATSSHPHGSALPAKQAQQSTRSWSRHTYQGPKRRTGCQSPNLLTVASSRLSTLGLTLRVRDQLTGSGNKAMQGVRAAGMGYDKLGCLDGSGRENHHVRNLMEALHTHRLSIDSNISTPVFEHTA